MLRRNYRTVNCVTPFTWQVDLDLNHQKQQVWWQHCEMFLFFKCQLLIGVKIRAGGTGYKQTFKCETAAIAKMKHQIVLFLLRQRESELISWCAIKSEHESKLASSSAFALRCCHLGFRRGSGSNPFMHWSRGRKARSTRRPHSWSPHTQLLLLYIANIASVTEEAKLLAELVGGKT